MSTSRVRQSEIALAYVQSILDTVRDPLLVLDSELRIVTASRAFCRVFQVTPAETVGQLLYELGNGQWRIPSLQEALEIALTREIAFDDYEVTHRFPAIGERTMLLNARKIWREENHTALLLLSMEDITERKIGEERLAAVRRELERSNTDLEAFARVAGHDLRAPLNSIVQFSQLLQRRAGKTLDADSRVFLQHITEAGWRMSQLITDLLQYALLAQASPQQLTPTPVSPTCCQAVANLSAAIQASQAEVRCDIPEEAQVRVENSRLIQLFQNLIGNGIHYRRPAVKPIVQTSGQRDGARWHFAVQDNGIGMEQHHLARIFQPFQRLHGPERPGSGLGLATCQRIVEQADGKLWVDSQPGQGSTFYIVLPKA